MSDREELTDEERAVICGAPSLATLGDAGAKVLRIIDACDADRAALVARVAELEAQCAEFEQQAHDWHVRALKLVSAESELTSLREDRAALVEQSALLKRERDEARAKAVAAGLAHQQAADEFKNQRYEQRYELASENVVLQSEVEMLRDAGCGRVLPPAEHPSQPAAPTIATPQLDPVLDKMRALQDRLEATDHDRAVLEACAAMKIRYDAKSGDIVVSGDMAVYRAELARREAKRV